MELDRLGSKLDELGVPRKQPAVLLLLPIAYCARLDGPLTDRQLYVLNRLIDEWYPEPEGARRAVRAWIAGEPSREQLANGVYTLRQLAGVKDQPTVAPEDLSRMLLACENVVRAGDAQPGDRSVEEALNWLCRELGVDRGRSWESVLADIRAANPELAPTVPGRDASGSSTDEQRVGTRAPLRRYRAMARTTTRPPHDPDGGLV